MKPQIALSPEQMRELQSLGLDCSDASMTWVGHNKGEKAPLLMCLENRNAGLFQQLERIPAYTLEDIICKTNADILSRPIGKGTMEWRCQIRVSDYDDFIYVNGFGNTPLEAAFTMLKYAIKEHPDKIKRL